MNDGGPAFPKPCDKCSHEPRLNTRCTSAQSGMSLRDWFAGMALQGIIASNAQLANGEKPLERNPDTVAQTAYLTADRMLFYATRQNER